MSRFFYAKMKLTPTTNTISKKELLAYELHKIVDLPGGKVLYGLHLALSLEVPSHELFDDQLFIDTLWQEMIQLPSRTAIQGIQVKEITEWPIDDEDALDMKTIPTKLKKMFERITPYIGKSHTKFYNVFVAIVSDDQDMTAERLFLN